MNNIKFSLCSLRFELSHVQNGARSLTVKLLPQGGVFKLQIFDQGLIEY